MFSVAKTQTYLTCGNAVKDTEDRQDVIDLAKDLRSLTRGELGELGRFLFFGHPISDDTLKRAVKKLDQREEFAR